MEIITRKDAIAQGLAHYFTGKPCKHGHYAPRYVSTRTCVECQAMHGKAFLAVNPGKSTEYSLRWQKKNPDKVREIESRRVRPQTDAIRARQAAYREQTRERRRAYVRQWQAAKAQSDPHFRFRGSLASLVLTSIRKRFGVKAHKTTALIGCTVEELMQHLESRFLPGMSWENHGCNGWHIDHIRPCASFDLTDPEQQRQCFHYSNLQPLWAVDNIRKGAKVA